MKKIITLLFITLISTMSMAQDVILDVRTPEEFASDHVQTAVNIDFKNDNFKSEILKLNKNDNYKLYCRSGNRSGKAVQLMTQLGFKFLHNLGSVEDAKKALGK